MNVRHHNLTALKTSIPRNKRETERNHDMKIAAIEQSKLAKTGQEYLDLLASDTDWIARTVDDVRQLRVAGDGAFAKLPEDDFYAFLASLEFKGGGVPMDATSH